MPDKAVPIRIPLSETHKAGLKAIIRKLKWAQNNFITIEKLLEYQEFLDKAIDLSRHTLTNYRFIPDKIIYQVINPLDDLINLAMRLIQNLLYRWERNYIPVP